MSKDNVVGCKIPERGRMASRDDDLSAVDRDKHFKGKKMEADPNMKNTGSGKSDKSGEDY